MLIWKNKGMPHRFALTASQSLKIFAIKKAAHAAFML